MVSTSEIKQGQQIYITYGSRSNSNLLLQYSFCYQDNPYDYVEVVRGDTYYYLKSERLNVDLLSCFRTGQLAIQGEIVALQHYLSLCEMLLAGLEIQTSTEDDMKALESESDFRVKFVIIYRLERKKIVQTHLHIAQMLLHILAKQGQQFKDVYM